MNLAIFCKNTDLACYYMMVTPFHDKPYEKNMKNLQTNIYLTLFSNFEYLHPSQSYKIFIRVSSEKTYCIVFCPLTEHWPDWRDFSNIQIKSSGY